MKRNRLEFLKMVFVPNVKSHHQAGITTISMEIEAIMILEIVKGYALIVMMSCITAIRTKLMMLKLIVSNQYVIGI